jgi:hypothetical protein
MPLWGANTNNESKPKNLTEEEKSRVFASERGWEITRPGHAGSEVLVAIRGLAGGVTTSTVKLGVATIDSVYFGAASYSTGATGTVRVVWNEKVTRRTTGNLSIISTASNGTSVSTIYATSLGAVANANFIDFTFTAPAATGTTLRISSQTISMGVNDLGSTTLTSDLTIILAEVKNAGLVTTARGGSTSVVTTV